MMDYLRYYLCSLTVGIAIIGFMLGGQWMWLGLGTFPVLMALDLLLGKDFAPRKINHPLIADIPLYLHVALMVALYATFAWRVDQGIGTSGGDTALALIGAFFTMLWLNMVPTVPVVHELMHRHGQIPRFFAKFGSAFFADMNRDVAHLMTHHIHFDTLKDSDTGVRGENVYRFMWRATKGSYLDAWETENRRLAARGKSAWSLQSMILWAVLTVALIFLAITLYAGITAGLVALASIIASKFMLEALNFLQHYGLVRPEGVPMGKQHTWNHLSTVSRIIGYEITTHIDHHKNGDLRFDQLVPHRDAPQMPSVFLCAVMVLFPPIWNRYAQQRLQEWDETFASPEERELARAANRRAGWPDWLAESTESVAA